MQSAQCAARRCKCGDRGNAECNAKTVGSVVNAYRQGAQLAKGATAAIEHCERWKILLIDYIHHKPIDNPYAHPYPSLSIYRRTHPPPHPSTTAPIHHRTHLPPYPSIARISISSVSGERVRQWQEWQGGCTDGWHCGGFSSILSPSYHCHEWNRRAGAREETRVRKLRDLDAREHDLLLNHMLAAMPGDADKGGKHQHSHTRRGLDQMLWRGIDEMRWRGLDHMRWRGIDRLRWIGMDYRYMRGMYYWGCRFDSFLRLLLFVQYYTKLVGADYVLVMSCATPGVPSTMHHCSRP
jgi:hypothetical protein